LGRSFIRAPEWKRSILVPAHRSKDRRGPEFPAYLGEQASYLLVSESPSEIEIDRTKLLWVQRAAVLVFFVGVLAPKLGEPIKALGS
jgi:hypothetical protein